MLLDLIRTNDALNQRQRISQEIGNVRGVIASRADFDEAALLYETLNGESGAQANKVTKRESDQIAAFHSLNQSEVTIAGLKQLTGLSNSTVGKLLYGYHSYGKTYSGLLDKCPAVSYLDRTVTRGDEACFTMRRTRVYLWDAVLDNAWKKDGSVWLCDDGQVHDPEDHDNSDPGSCPEPEEAFRSYEISLSDMNSRGFPRFLVFLIVTGAVCVVSVRLSTRSGFLIVHRRFSGWSALRAISGLCHVRLHLSFRFRV